uniref:hypothetical protein n=1 Tax=Agathobacter sp. TaxID=2021311 RepID=UPI004057234F
MFFKSKKKLEEKSDKMKHQIEITEEDLELTDEEFFLAEEIDGYSCCEGMNAERCSSECFKAVMMPTVTVIS